MNRVRAWGSLLVFVAGLFIAAAPSREGHAYVPRTTRVIDAVADANRSGKRVRALRYELNLRIGDGAPVAVGELVSHPTGLARLELRATGGLVERHILLGNQHTASRNARLLVRPRAFLPPLFVLQSNSGAVLEAALGTLQIDRRLLGLAPCGDHDCYVIGDPMRAIQRPRVAAEMKAQAEAAEAAQAAKAEQEQEAADEPIAQDAIDATTAMDMNSSDVAEGNEDEGNDFASAPAPTPAHDFVVDEPDPYHPSLWVDTEDHNIRRLETSEGVIITLGPYVKFEHVTVPRFWSIQEPGKREVRFEVEGVVEVNAPAAAFSKTWLMAPLIQDAEPQADEHVLSTTLEPLAPTPAVSGGPSEEDLEAAGFDESPGEGYDYPN